MRVLLVVDVQKEFAKGLIGKSVYKKCISYIQRNRAMYDQIVACVYKNEDNPNMNRLLQWREMKDIQPLDFSADFVYQHSGYSISEYPPLEQEDVIDVIGFDTDACVLSTCFDLFNKHYNFSILSNLCYSSGGSVMHESALRIMKRQFGSAVAEVR